MRMNYFELERNIVQWKQKSGRPPFRENCTSVWFKNLVVRERRVEEMGESRRRSVDWESFRGRVFLLPPQCYLLMIAFNLLVIAFNVHERDMLKHY